MARIRMAAAVLVAAAAGLAAAWHGRPSMCQGYDCPRFEIVESYGPIELRRYDEASWIVRNFTDSSFNNAVWRGFRELYEYIDRGNRDHKKVDMTTPLVTAAYPRNNSDSCGGGRSRELFDDAYVKQVLEESPNAKFTPGDDFGEDLFIPESLAAEESAAAAETSAVAAVAAAKAVSGGCDHHSGALLRKFNVAFFVPSYIQGTPPEPLNSALDVIKTPEFEAWVLPFGGWATPRRVERLGLSFLERIKAYHAKDSVRSVFFVAQYNSPFRLFNRHNEIWVIRKCKGGKRDDDNVGLTNDDGGSKARRRRRSSSSSGTAAV